MKLWDQVIDNWPSRTPCASLLSPSRYCWSVIRHLSHLSFHYSQHHWKSSEIRLSNCIIVSCAFVILDVLHESCAQTIPQTQFMSDHVNGESTIGEHRRPYTFSVFINSWCLWLSWCFINHTCSFLTPHWKVFHCSLKFFCVFWTVDSHFFSHSFLFQSSTHTLLYTLLQSKHEKLQSS